MGFEYETSATQRWPTMQAEHDLLLETIRTSGYGWPENLDHRCMDRQRQTVVYAARGLGSGHGMNFALVHAGFVVWAAVWKPGPGSRHNGGDIGRVCIAPAWQLGRAETLAWLLDALSVYHAHDNPLERFDGPASFDISAMTWEVTIRRTASPSLYQPEPSIG